MVVGTSTKQRLQSVRTEFVVLPQVVVAVYVAEDEDPPYFLFAGMSAPHIVCASKHILSHAPMKHTLEGVLGG